jgi:hypothetical protein
MKSVFWSVLLLSTSSVTASAAIFSRMYKVLCPYKSEGCECVDGNGKILETFFHAMPATGLKNTDQIAAGATSVEILTTKSETCSMSSNQLQPIYWASDKCPNQEQIKAVPFASLEKMTGKNGGFQNLEPAGKIYPTYYTIADENLHDGPKTERLFEAETGALIATVTKTFRDDLDLEGTGVLSDGRILNVGVYSNASWTYVVLPKNTYGSGVAGHFLYPFRGAAVDFEWLCQAGNLGDCSGGRAAVTKRYAGTMMYFPRLVGLPLPNGSTHDGYLCANDIGGVILGSRIDMFVGPTGGGNPYLQQCHYENAYIKAGIKSLVTWDWRLFKELDPKPDGTRVFKKSIQDEYLSHAAEKGLEFSIVKGMKCLKRW